MSDERAAVSRISGLLSKKHLQRGERANDPQPRLHDDQADAGKMQRTKPGISHPIPAARTAHENRQQPDNHERDEAHVQDQHDIGERAKNGSVHVCLAADQATTRCTSICISSRINLA